MTHEWHACSALVLSPNKSMMLDEGPTNLSLKQQCVVRSTTSQKKTQTKPTQRSISPTWSFLQLNHFTPFFSQSATNASFSERKP